MPVQTADFEGLLREFSSREIRFVVIDVTYDSELVSTCSVCKRP